MFLSLIQLRTGCRATRRWLWCGLLAIFLGLFSATAISRGTVLFEDHFDDESSLENWDLTSKEKEWVENGKLYLKGCFPKKYGCPTFLDFDSYAALRHTPERNFELTVNMQPLDVPHGRIMLNMTDYSSDYGQAYELIFANSAGSEPTTPLQYDHVYLVRQNISPLFPYTGSRLTVAEESFAPIGFPVQARVVVRQGSIRLILNETEQLVYTDPNPLSPGRIGLGISVLDNRMTFDDMVVKALPDLRCSTDAGVDGKDQMCQGGLFEQKLWAYLGPDDHKIARVDFYLDGKFHRREFHTPWELDGGSVTKLRTGPHEIKAKVRYRDGSRASFIAGFEVGEHSLRCSPDPVLDGNDAACEGGTFDAPTWVYWWPENGVESVEYSINRVFHRTERLPPFELDGGAASAFSGSSVIRATVQYKDGRQPLTVETHANAPSIWGPLLCSADAVLDGGEGTDFPCNWGLVPEPVQAYFWPEDGIRSVDFYLDGTFHRTERYAPFELDGGAKTDLPAGTHDITAIVHYVDAGKPATAISTQVSAP